MPDIYKKIPDFSASNDCVISATELKKAFEAIERGWLFPNNGISAKNGGKNSMKFTFYTVDTSRIDKTNNTKVDTIMTCVHIGDKVGYATCDKEDYDEREGILNAIANLCCDGSFDKAYRTAVKEKKISETLDRTCSYCRKVFDTIAEREAHEAWHVERRKARHERYLLRKRAKEIAFEEQAQKMAKEMIEK